jgi:hypothetical protein
MTTVLYIIAHRSANQYREKNLNITLEWIDKVKKNFDNLSNKNLIFDIIIVEQDNTQRFNIQPWKHLVKYLWIFNSGSFNKGWAFNVTVKKYPNYNYYIFADNDLIFPNINGFCYQIIKNCLDKPQKGFRLFTQCLDISEQSLCNCQTLTLNDVIEKYYNNQLISENRIGLTFAGGMIAISRDLYFKVGGWDEEFDGWGRHDDFMTFKLLILGRCNPLICPLPVLHLWHPITDDFRLEQKTIDLYNRCINLTKEQLYERILYSLPFQGDPFKYTPKS